MAKTNSPACIDLVLTGDRRKASNINVIETGLLDFHAMVAITLKGSFRKKA